MVAVDVLLGRLDEGAAVDLVVCVLDASNLGRNLYLLSQVLELGLPTVVAVNMLDVAESRGVKIDWEELEKRLGVPVIPTQAVRHVGISDLKAAIHRAVDSPRRPHTNPLPAEFQKEVDDLADWFASQFDTTGQRGIASYLVERLILDVNGYLAASCSTMMGTRSTLGSTKLASGSKRWGYRSPEWNPTLAMPGSMKCSTAS